VYSDDEELGAFCDFEGDAVLDRQQRVYRSELL